MKQLCEESQQTGYYSITLNAFERVKHVLSLCHHWHRHTVTRSCHNFFKSNSKFQIGLRTTQTHKHTLVHISFLLPFVASSVYPLFYLSSSFPLLFASTKTWTWVIRLAYNSEQASTLPPHMSSGKHMPIYFRQFTVLSHSQGKHHALHRAAYDDLMAMHNPDHMRIYSEFVKIFATLES